MWKIKKNIHDVITITEHARMLSFANIVTIDATVTVGGAACDVTASSASEIVCTLSSASSGAQDITVTTQPGGMSSLPSAFEYLFAAMSVMPASGTVRV